MRQALIPGIVLCTQMAQSHCTFLSSFHCYPFRLFNNLSIQPQRFPSISTTDPLHNTKIKMKNGNNSLEGDTAAARRWRCPEHLYPCAPPGDALGDGRGAVGHELRVAFIDELWNNTGN